jgi:hypothetical protein
VDLESLRAAECSLAYARNLPLDLEREVGAVLSAKLSILLRDGTATSEQAVEETAVALEALVAQAR